jgi:chaperonin GroEL
MKEIYQKVNFEPHKEIIEGAEILYRAVSTTMGPSGQCVVIDLNDGTPKITKDGVTVAKAINLKENLQGVGANLIKEVAAKTNEAAGDGTTTATVFSYNLLKKAYAGIATGHSPIEVKRGIEHASELAMVLLKDYSREVKSVEDIESSLRAFARLLSIVSNLLNSILYYSARVILSQSSFRSGY